MAELGAYLQNMLALWQADMAHSLADGAVRVTEPALTERRVSVIIHHATTGDALRAAGLDLGINENGFATGIIALADVAQLAEIEGVTSVDAERPVALTLDTSIKEIRVPWKVPPTAPWPGKGSGAIVAVLDTGIDIFHESFRKSDGTTRILELWDQGATAGGVAPPAGFSSTRGRVFDRAAINAGITAGGTFASVDTNGHGTHVAGIAAGNGLQDDRCSFPGHYVGVAPEADLIIVKTHDLPTGANASIPEAFQFCFGAPARLGIDKPVVINCSFASDIGPHDGHDALDVLVDQQMRPGGGAPPAGRVIVAGAGNAASYELHEEGVVAANGNTTVRFTIPEGSKTDNLLDIWYTGASTLSVEIVAPPNPAVGGGNTTGVVTPATPGSPFTIGLMNVAITFQGPFPANGNRKRIFVTISLAGTPPPANTDIRSGVWELRFTETSGTAANWDAWFQIKHEDSFPTFKVEGDPSVTLRRRLNTVGSPAMSLNAIAVASYDDDGGSLAESSSRGPAVAPAGLAVGELKPTLAAPGVGILAARSKNDPKSRSSCCDQKVIDKGGTSMAAPHITGLVALMLDKNRLLTFEQVRAHLQRAARIDSIPVAEQPPVVDVPMNIRHNNLWGSGKVNAAQVLADIPPASAFDGGGGGGGGGTIAFDDPGWNADSGLSFGYVPHSYVSRLADWRTRHGARPGLMLFAALVSEHVDEVLRLINQDRRVGAVWQRQGGPSLVRHLLHGPPPGEVVLPEVVEECRVASLLDRVLAILTRKGGDKLRADIGRYGEFARVWPGATLDRLDEAAALVAGAA